MVIHEQIKDFISEKKKCDGSHNSLMKEFALIKLEGDTFPLPPFPLGREHRVILLAGFPWAQPLTGKSVMVKGPWETAPARAVSMHVKCIEMLYFLRL